MTADLLTALSLAFGWWLLRNAGYDGYLRSPGWKLTRILRKRGRCAKCKTGARLELHHESYWWHNRLKVLFYLLPNLLDPMVTLCASHHAQAHGKG